MPAHPMKMTLRGMMKLIAAAAGILCLVCWDRGPFVAYPGLLVLLVAALVRFGRMTQLRAVVCVFIAYPWLLIFMLYLAWSSAWVVLGQRPPWLNSSSLGPVVSFFRGMTGLFLIGSPFLCVAGPILLFTEAMISQDDSEHRRGFAARYLILAAISFWMSALAWLTCDPGHALTWLLD